MMGFLCGPHIYEYEGWLFEAHSYCGPWPLKQNGDPRKRAGKNFWQMIDRFDHLGKAEREQYRGGGGCTVLTPGSTVTAVPVELY